MSRTYNASELQQIIDRHREAAAGPRLVALFLAAMSGFGMACLLFWAIL